MNRSKAIKKLFKIIDDKTGNKYDANELLISSNNILNHFLNDEKRDLEIINDNYRRISTIDNCISDSNYNLENYQKHLLYPNSEDYESTYGYFSKNNNLKELKYA